MSVTLSPPLAAELKRLTLNVAQSREQAILAEIELMRFTHTLTLTIAQQPIQQVAPPPAPPAPPSPSAPSAPSAPSPQNEKSLDITVYEILLGKPMTLKDLVKQVMFSGYQTRTSGDGFTKCVSQSISKIKAIEVCHRDAETGIYSVRRTSIERMRERLSLLCKQRRKGNDPK